MASFYRGLAIRLEVFDPLDRPFMCESQDDSDSIGQEDEPKVVNQGITCLELHKKIIQMKGVKGSDLNMPLTQKMYKKL